MKTHRIDRVNKRNIFFVSPAQIPSPPFKKKKEDRLSFSAQDYVLVPSFEERRNSNFYIFIPANDFFNINEKKLSGPLASRAARRRFVLSSATTIYKQTKKRNYREARKTANTHSLIFNIVPFIYGRITSSAVGRFFSCIFHSALLLITACFRSN